MNRIRSIKPEIRRNRKIADCGIVATLLSRELITYADDQGRFPASTREIKAECFPYHDALKLAQVEEALLALAAPAVGFVELYEVDGERYGWMPGFLKHQILKADRITWSDLPPPPGYRPEMMSKALHARWLHDASAGELPARGDGSLAGRRQTGPAPEPAGSGLEPERRQLGAIAAPAGTTSEPRARGRAGADRTGPERTGPERTGEEQRASGSKPEPSVTPMPLSPEVKQRVNELQEGCLQILAARPLKPGERDLVLGWASTLRRAGELVPCDLVLAVVRRKMAEPTPDGTLPANLAWCADDVAALARERAGPDLGGLPRSVRDAVTYDQQLAAYAERLRQEGR